MSIKSKLAHYLPDSIYLSIMYKRVFHKPLNLRNPKTFNEKLQWLKLHDRKPIYTSMVDKYEAKKYVSTIIGEKFIIPTIGIWNKFDDIDFDSLPDQFVLKCTHDSGGLVICKDKSSFDKDKARVKINESLKRNFYYSGREWPYKNIPPRIIAEKYMEDESGGLQDYKFFCFNGIVDNAMVVRGRSEGKPKYYHFDKEWNLCRFNRLTRSLPVDYHEDKPAFIDDMIQVAEKLSQGIPHIRVDLYYANNQIFFGELTFYNESGFETGFDDYSDTYLGSLIQLPKKGFLK